MASIKQHGTGYRAQVYVKGERDSRSFSTRREASAWASQRELELRSQQSSSLGKIKTLEDALDKYVNEVAVNHKGFHWESIRIEAFKRTLPIKLKMSDLTDRHLSEWRDARLKDVKQASVLREFKLLSSVLETARRDWKWTGINVAKDVRKPASSPHRDRVITRHEIKIMLRQLRYQKQPRSFTSAVAVCFLVALRTGMRAGELTGLTWDRVFDRHVVLPDTKNGSKRHVPISSRAKAHIERMRGFDPEFVFGLSAQTLDATFRKARARAFLSGFTFHDTRHTAATWIGKSGKLNLMEMCSMFGWKDPKQAMVYFNPDAWDLAAKL